MTWSDHPKNNAHALDRPCPEQQAMAHEHGLLMRQLASLQRGVGERLQIQARHITALEAEVLRLRAQLIAARTCLLWGLPHEQLARVRPLHRPAMAPLPDPALRQAHAVICQTGCVGHAHPWLQADGLCRRTGEACHTLSSVAPAPSDRPAADLPMVVDLKR